MPETVRLGLMGLGYIAKIHMLAAQSAPVCLDKEPVRVKYASLFTTHPGTVGPLASYLGFERVCTDMDEFLDSTGIDGVDICTPNALHEPQASAALKRGLAVYCEKPLGMNVDEARALAQQVKERPVPNMVALNGRFSPSVLRAKSYIESGVIGDVLTARAHLFHSSYLDENRPTSWRLQNSLSGGGSLADLGIHVIDRLRFLVGEVVTVRATTRTFISGRPKSKGSSERVPVDVDDWALVEMDFACGASGVVESSRISSGADGTAVEIFGTRGSIRLGGDEWPTVHVFATGTEYRGLPVEMDAGRRELLSLYPGSKMSVGSMVNGHMVTLLRYGLAILREESVIPGAPDFEAAAGSQEVLEAAYFSGAHGGQAVELPLPARCY